MARARSSRLLLPRVAGALLLRSPVYREAANDESAGIQAGLVVIIAGIVEGTVWSAAHGLTKLDPQQILYSVLAALIGWIAWSGIVFVVAKYFFEHPLAFRPVLRSVAFAHAPALGYGLAVLPPLTPWAGLFLLASLVWFTAALVACVRGITDASLGRSLGITAAALLAHEALHQALRIVGAMD